MRGGSKRFELNSKDAVKLAKGAGIAAAGAAVTYLAEWVAGTDFGDYTPVVVAAAGILVNVARKWISDQSK